MNTTATAAGWAIPAEQLTWDRSDWIDALQDGCRDTYASSVIWAASDDCLLALPDLDRLLAHHGFSRFEYGQEWARAALQGLEVLPLQHAAQAVIWLGY